MISKAISRRQFAKESGLLVVGFSLAGAVSPVLSWMSPAVADSTTKSVSPGQLDSWLTIDETSTVTVYTGRIDMGTGLETAFSQIVAEELDVPVGQVKMVMGDTRLTPDQGKSTGSSGTSRGAQPLRVAAAEARRALLAMAAQHFNVTPAELAVKDGIVQVKERRSRRISFGALMKGRLFDQELTVVREAGPVLAAVAKIKNPSEHTVVGQSVPRVDIPAKACGAFRFVQDVRLPGMLHGRVVRPPSLGARLLEVDETSVSRIPTVVKVVRKADFLGVVAEREEHAIAAAGELKARWSESRELPEQQNLYSATRRSPLIKKDIWLDQGDVASALAASRRTFEATYHFPIQLHGMMGPSCAVADVSSDVVTVWSGTQWPQGTRADLVQMLGVPLDKVRVIWVQAAGSYGRLSCDDAAADAALLSQAVGRPVRVQWTRQDEHRWEPVSPAMVMDVRAGLDGNGNIAAWDLEQWSSSHSISERGNMLAWRLMGTAPGWGRLSSAPGLYSYVFPNTRQTANYVEPILRTIYLRAPGRIQHNFASESFMDELASAAGGDPIEFRLRHLKDPNVISLVKTVARQANWEAGVMPHKKTAGTTTAVGRGFAFGEHSEGQQVALVVDLTVNLETADIRLGRIITASQCGLIINPEGLKHQVQGAILHGVSRTLLEELTFDPAAVSSLDWTSYPILKFSQVPPVEVTLINQPDVPSSGVGETATIPVAAAIGNAIFDATGIRLRQVPLQPELRKVLKM